MADKAEESLVDSDKVTQSADKQAEDEAVTTLLDEVWNKLSHLGIGSLAEMPLESPSLPAMELLDPEASIEASPPPLQAPLELPPPPTRIATDDVTMDIYPDVDLKNKEVTINVKGQF